MATENDDTKELLLTRLNRVRSRSGEAAMKSTEADGNALQTLGSSPTKTMTGGNPDQVAAVQPDIRRRRLVRGAAAVAPMVLTLRSGALAAASCTGAKIISIDSTGQIDRVGLNDTDVCFTDQQVCPGYPLSGPHQDRIRNPRRSNCPDLSRRSLCLRQPQEHQRGDPQFSQRILPHRLTSSCDGPLPGQGMTGAWTHHGGRLQRSVRQTR
jgi:hypothetical protein